MTIATCPDYAPYEFLDLQGKMVGADISLVLEAMILTQRLRPSQPPRLTYVFQGWCLKRSAKG